MQMFYIHFPVLQSCEASFPASVWCQTGISITMPFCSCPAGLTSVHQMAASSQIRRSHQSISFTCYIPFGVMSGATVEQRRGTARTNRQCVTGRTHTPRDTFRVTNEACVWKTHTCRENMLTPHSKVWFEPVGRVRQPLHHSAARLNFSFFKFKKRIYSTS